MQSNLSKGGGIALPFSVKRRSVSGSDADKAVLACGNNTKMNVRKHNDGSYRIALHPILDITEVSFIRT
ncbi:hypothetical protein POVWA2_007330 [Plasmodium ovale wallikeri]|uniref:Uncharacterized protein n=1 Tax=Plasmodium ovale wallikeri TaxID=864142 RepID=A0A1A8YKH2_PLAOA|nr:hypothetical protein POVWA1_007190 [Plasmodium ovale wallikeri]SBT32031.1 hypothetical protein POVWA2_007330 [Plasmodium ovale wallikeri]